MTDANTTNDYTERLSLLLELMELEEYDKVAFDCQSLLQLEDVPAALAVLLQEIQIKSYIGLQDWNKVIELSSSNSGNNSSSSLTAYAHYRLKQYNKAKDVAATSASDDTLSQHVLAQSLYRLGETSQATSKYQQLLLQQQQQAAEEDEEGNMQVLSNALAVKLAAAPTPIGYSAADDGEEDELVQQALGFMSKAGDTYYDLEYNLGTYQVLVQGNIEDGVEHLEAAQEAATAELAGDDAVLREELRPILTNLAWSRGQSHQKAGGDDYVSKMNASVASKKLLPKDFVMPPTATLYQRKLFHYNQAVLALHNTLNQPQKIVAGIVKHHVSALKGLLVNKKDSAWFSSRCTALEARVLHQLQGKPSDASKLLTNAIAKDDNDDAAVSSFLQLQKAHLEGKLEDPASRLEVLNNIPLAHARAVVATRASLYQSLGEKVPDDLFDHPSDRAEFWLQQEQYQQAADYFATQDDAPSQAKYALCLSYMGQADKAMEVWKQVGVSIDKPELSHGEALEQAPLPRVARSVIATSLAADNNLKPKKSREDVMKRRAKQREAYLEGLQNRGLDTTKAPNAERWIPKYERSRNRKRSQHKGAQGGFTEKDAAKFDIFAKKSGTAMDAGGPSTAHMTVAGNNSKGRGGRRR